MYRNFLENSLSCMFKSRNIIKHLWYKLSNKAKVNYLQSTEWKKNANYLSDKELIFRIYKELIIQ